MRKFSFILFLFISNNIIAQISVNSSNDLAWEQLGVQRDFKKLNGKKKITLAIIDDAFQTENLGLKSYLKNNTKEFPGNNVDEDNNGKIDDYLGWDMSDNDTDVNPPFGSIVKFSHGTKVAGIVIEGLNKILTNAKEVVKILPIKSSSDTRNNNYITDGYVAIKYAIEQRVDIIVCSWSGGIFDKEKEEILIKAKEAGIIIIAASGNFVSEKEQFPAAFPWAINTAALNKNLQKQLVSNYGKFVDISIPSDSIITISTLPNASSSTLSGTSASTALLGGIIAALYAAFPELKPEDCDRLLKNACEPLEKHNPLYKGKLGAGVLNINRLISDIETQKYTSNTSIPKGYIPVSKTIYHVYALAKYPNYKLINTNPQTKKNLNLKLTSWSNNIKKDTVLNLLDLNSPYYFQSDSFQISSNKNRNSFLYFEAQAIDSSYLYCSESLHLTDKNGTITDGSADANYANNSSCKWEIEVAKNKRIKITFDEMDIEAKIDQVYIFSDFGTESPILAIFSGQNLPPQITTWTNRALIWFVSNGSTNLKGWKLRYEEVD
jgi:serine protease